MDLESCRILVTLVKLGSFSKTAEALHMAQSTVSQRIQHLEDALGVALIVRGREIRLTEAGEAFLPHARRIIDTELAGEAAVRPFVTEVSGDVRIAASQTTGGYILPRLVCRFGERYPSVRITLRIANSEEVVRSVDDGEVDFGIIESPLATQRLTQRDWLEDELVLVVGRDHPLSNETFLAPEDVHDLLLAIREGGSGTRDTLVRAWPLPLASSFRLLEMGSLSAIRQAVLTGRAAAFLSGWVVNEDIAAGRMAALSVRGVTPKRTMRLVRRREPFPSKAAELLHESVFRSGPGLAPLSQGIRGPLETGDQHFHLS